MIVPLAITFGSVESVHALHRFGHGVRLCLTWRLFFRRFGTIGLLSPAEGGYRRLWTQDFMPSGIRVDWFPRGRVSLVLKQKFLECDVRSSNDGIVLQSQTITELTRNALPSNSLSPCFSGYIGWYFELENVFSGSARAFLHPLYWHQHKGALDQ